MASDPEVTDANAATWVGLYRAVSKRIGGFRHDPKVENCNALFYLPRHPESGDDSYRVEVIAGGAVDFSGVDPLPIEPEKTKKKKAPTKDKAWVDDGAVEQAIEEEYQRKDWLIPGFGVFAWECSQYLALSKLFRHFDPGGHVADRNGGGRVHRCPNHTKHSTKFEEVSQGHFVCDAGEANGRATSHCMHTHCEEHGWTDRADMILRKAAKERGKAIEIEELYQFVEKMPEEQLAALKERLSRTPFKNYDDALAAVNSLGKGDISGGMKVVNRLAATKIAAMQMELLKKSIGATTGAGVLAVKATYKEAQDKARQANAEREKPVDGSGGANPSGTKWMPSADVVVKDGYWEVKKGESFERIGVPFWPLTKIADAKKEGFTTIIGFHDEFGNLVQIPISSADVILAGHQQLAAMGNIGYRLINTKRDKDWLVEWLGEAVFVAGLPYALRVNKPGWYNIDGKSVYVDARGVCYGDAPPGGVFLIGGAKDRDAGGTEAKQREIWNTLGDSSDPELENRWHWPFGLFAAGAGVLLGLLTEIEPGGCAIVGEHGGGKTSIARVVAGFMANPKEKRGVMFPAKGSDNGLEAIAETGNHGTLVIDDLGKTKADALQAIMLMFGSETGGNRMNGSGVGARGGAEFRTFVLMTSERSAFELSKKMVAGVADRIPNVMIPNAPKLPVGHRLLKALDAARENYGHLGGIFIRHLIEKGYTTYEKRAEMLETLQGHVLALVDGNVDLQRPLTKVALSWLSGELMKECGLLPESCDVEGVCKKAAASIREGDTGAAVTSAGVENAIRTSIVRLRDEGRIVDLDVVDDGHFRRDIVGYFRAEEAKFGTASKGRFYILKDHVDEIGGSVTTSVVLNTLINAGALVMQGKNRYRQKIPGRGSLDNYTIDLGWVCGDRAETDDGAQSATEVAAAIVEADLDPMKPLPEAKHIVRRAARF